MLNRYIIILLISVMALVLGASREPVYPEVNQESFAPGEALIYKASFGFFRVGEAKVVIDERVRAIEDRPAYKVDIYGRTTGMVDWVAQVDDHWGAYVDTTALLPHLSYRNIKEGDYRKNEITRFNHSDGVIERLTLDQKTGKYKSPEVYRFQQEDLRDIVAGYLYLRTVDFSDRVPGDVIRINGFLEDTIYPLDFEFIGRERLKTKAGSFNALRLRPLMPEGGIFDGKKSVTMWLSDDENKIPLRVEAKMFVGNASFEITEFQHLKNPVNYR